MQVNSQILINDSSYTGDRPNDGAFMSIFYNSNTFVQKWTDELNILFEDLHRCICYERAFQFGIYWFNQDQNCA